jgi:hypothetical protein
MAGTAEIQQLLGTDPGPELGPKPRGTTWSEAEVKRKVEEAGLPSRGKQRDLIRALVLLWHDHLEAAHVIAQEVDDPNGAFVHAIMHRREPDYGNAKYWFRRVGEHQAFGRIASRVSKLLEAHQESGLGTNLIHNGKWDAFAFVDACEKVAQLPADNETVRLLREIQRIETESLLEHFTA